MCLDVCWKQISLFVIWYQDTCSSSVMYVRSCLRGLFHNLGRHNDICNTTTRHVSESGSGPSGARGAPLRNNRLTFLLRGVRFGMAILRQDKFVVPDRWILWYDCLQVPSGLLSLGALDRRNSTVRGIELICHLLAILYLSSVVYLPCAGGFESCEPGGVGAPQECRLFSV